MKEPQYNYSIDSEGRMVSIFLPNAKGLELHVPELFGEIQGLELKGDFWLVSAARGRVSFHAETPRVGNMPHPLAGKMHWHAMRNLWKKLCLLQSLKRRVDLQITYYRYKSGGSSPAAVGGKILVDKRVVFQFSDSLERGATHARELGASLADYLYLTPQEALRTSKVFISSLALLDRRLTDEEFMSETSDRFDHVVWRSFRELRLSHVRLKHEAEGPEPAGSCD